MRLLSDIFSGEMTLQDKSFLSYEDIRLKKEKYKVNILALGDVGGTLLLAMKLLGGEIIDSIGICDISEKVLARYEMEMNQISWPFPDEDDSLSNHLPKVEIISQDKLFDCDCFVFCASKGVPPVGNEQKDVRMVQYEVNKDLVQNYAKLAKDVDFKGIFAVVSDPVDPLCMAAVKGGLSKSQVRGFGLGVMNGRARYFASKDEKFKSYLSEGRAFGPHGNDLVIANSIENYNDEISKELTNLTVNSNLKTRELGFKPYIAPAVSSGAMSIISMLSGKWHYSSICFGDAFLGMKNRLCHSGTLVENIPLNETLFSRIETALNNLRNIK